MEFSAAAARPDNNCCMPYGVAPEPVAPGIDDSSCFLNSSSVSFTGKTQLLYQGHALHCIKAWASSRMSVTERPPFWLNGSLQDLFPYQFVSLVIESEASVILGVDGAGLSYGPHSLALVLRSIGRGDLPIQRS